MVLATCAPTLGFGERAAELAERLELAAGGPPTAFPPNLFDDPSLDPHSWYRTTAERVAASFESWGYTPDLETLIYGLVDFSARATTTLMESTPESDHAVIQAGMVDLAIQIVAKTRASDGTRHASRSTGNRLRNLYLDRMRDIAARCGERDWS